MSDLISQFGSGAGAAIAAYSARRSSDVIRSHRSRFLRSVSAASHLRMFARINAANVSGFDMAGLQ